MKETEYYLAYVDAPVGKDKKQIVRYYRGETQNSITPYPKLAHKYDYEKSAKNAAQSMVSRFALDGVAGIEKHDSIIEVQEIIKKKSNFNS